MAGLSLGAAVLLNYTYRYGNVRNVVLAAPAGHSENSFPHSIVEAVGRVCGPNFAGRLSEAVRRSDYRRFRSEVQETGTKTKNADRFAFCSKTYYDVGVGDESESGASETGNLDMELYLQLRERLSGVNTSWYHFLFLFFSNVLAQVSIWSHCPEMKLQLEEVLVKLQASSQCKHICVACGGLDLCHSARLESKLDMFAGSSLPGVDWRRTTGFSRAFGPWGICTRIEAAHDHDTVADRECSGLEDLNAGHLVSHDESDVEQGDSRSCAEGVTAREKVTRRERTIKRDLLMSALETSRFTILDYTNGPPDVPVNLEDYWWIWGSVPQKGRRESRRDNALSSVSGGDNVAPRHDPGLSEQMHLVQEQPETSRTGAKIASNPANEIVHSKL